LHLPSTRVAVDCPAAREFPRSQPSAFARRELGMQMRVGQRLERGRRDSVPAGRAGEPVLAAGKKRPSYPKAALARYSAEIDRLLEAHGVDFRLSARHKGFASYRVEPVVVVKHRNVRVAAGRPGNPSWRP
jgi:hypothetical protein